MNALEAVPSLLLGLKDERYLSSRWIAQATGRQLKHIHEMLPKIEDGRNFDHQVDSRGYVTEVWIPLTDALILISAFEGERATKARNLIRDAVNYYLDTRPRLEAELAEALEHLRHKEQLTALLADDNTRLRNENQAAAEKAPTTRAAASRRKGKRMLVPVLHGDLFHGVKVVLEHRYEGDCTPWQWALGMIPWLMHVKDGLDERVTENKELAFHGFLEKFDNREITHEQVEETWRRVIDEIQHVQPTERETH